VQKTVEQIKEIVGKKQPVIVGKNLADAALNFVVVDDDGAAVIDYPLADGVTYVIIPLPADIDTSKIADGVTELKS